jgi:hypothetical protein
LDKVRLNRRLLLLNQTSIGEYNQLLVRTSDVGVVDVSEKSIGEYNPSDVGVVDVSEKSIGECNPLVDFFVSTGVKRSVD